MTLKRTRAKRRPNGTGCQMPGRKSCRSDAYTTVWIGEKDVRVCARHAADLLFAARIRAMNGGRCVAEGQAGVDCGGRIQCAHIIRRNYHAIRWSDDNAVPLCAGHHVWFTHHPLEWETFCRWSGIDYDGLRHRAFNDPPENPLDVLERLGAA